MIDLRYALDDEFDFVERNAASIFVRELKEIECQRLKIRRWFLPFPRFTLAVASARQKVFWHAASSGVAM
jgi:hypothetical protein